MPADMIPVAMLAGGSVLLYLGGNLLVTGAVGLSKQLGVSTLFIGLVVVAFGTSAPELVVSVDAVIRDKPEIAVGNVIGSNIANVMLILALAALIAPLADRGRVVLRDGAAMLAATGLLMWFAARGGISTEGGYVLLGLLFIYLVWSWFGERTIRNVEEVAEVRTLPFLRISAGWIDLIFTLGGLALLVFGARLVVTGGVDLARLLGVSEAVIGVSMVAIGTSLPELAATAVAAARGQTGIALGNIVGSNIFNILAILGIATLVKPVAIAPEFMERDVWVMLGAAGVLALICTTRWRFGRIEAVVLLAAYGFYIYALYNDLMPKAAVPG